MNRSIEDRAREYGKICKHIDCLTCELQDDCVWRFQYLAYKDGATQQKAIDDKYIKLLEEDRNAFIAYYHRMYISVIDAAKEQLGYLEKLSNGGISYDEGTSSKGSHHLQEMAKSRG